jgi:hypothetical protein
MHNPSNTIEFQYDNDNDVVIAHPYWVIKTEEDCALWYRQYEAYFKTLNKGKVDVIFVLDNFEVSPAIAICWGKFRADMVNTFTRHSVRVHASVRISTVVNTSGAIYGASSDEAPDIATAVKHIHGKRNRTP